ncbi:efflux RND transporter permease subunit [Sorangium sp. So ce1128]
MGPCLRRATASGDSGWGTCRSKSSALALGPGAEIRAPMAAAVIGGLLVSTALSLLVVPAFYVFADDIQGWVARLRARRARRHAPPAHPATPP